jgi:hypothetical protein
MYTEDKEIWKKINRSYSDVTRLMAEYYSAKTGNAPFAKQYTAPMRKLSTFENMLNVKMEK